MTDPKLPPWPAWAGDRKRCCYCLRPTATADDEAIWQAAESSDDLPAEWRGDNAPALCWHQYGGECECPEWIEDVTPLDVLQLRAEIERLRKLLDGRIG